MLAHRLEEWTEGTGKWLRGVGARLVVGCRVEYWEGAGFSGSCCTADVIPRHPGRYSRPAFGWGTCGPMRPAGRATRTGFRRASSPAPTPGTRSPCGSSPRCSPRCPPPPTPSSTGTTCSPPTSTSCASGSRSGWPRRTGCAAPPYDASPPRCPGRCTRPHGAVSARDRGVGPGVVRGGVPLGPRTRAARRWHRLGVSRPHRRAHRARRHRIPLRPRGVGGLDPGHPPGPGRSPTGPGPPPPHGTNRAPLPVPHHRIGPVVQALLLLARQHGAPELAVKLEELTAALDADPDSWWAAHLLAEVLLRVPDATPYDTVLRLLADQLVARRRQHLAVPREFEPHFWTGAESPALPAVRAAAPTRARRRRPRSTPPPRPDSSTPPPSCSPPSPLSYSRSWPGGSTTSGRCPRRRRRPWRRPRRRCCTRIGGGGWTS